MVLFPVDGYAVLAGPSQHRFLQSICLGRLDGAPGCGHHLMAAPAVKPGLGHALYQGTGVHGFVPVAFHLSAYDLQPWVGCARQPLQGILHPLLLIIQLFFIGHMPKVAAAAPGEGRAPRLLPCFRRAQQLFDAGIGFVFQAFDDPQAAQIAPYTPFHKDYLAIHPAKAHALAGIPGDLRRMYAVFLQCHGCNPSAKASPKASRGMENV